MCTPIVPIGNDLDIFDGEVVWSPAKDADSVSCVVDNTVSNNYIILSNFDCEIVRFVVFRCGFDDDNLVFDHFVVSSHYDWAADFHVVVTVVVFFKKDCRYYLTEQADLQ